jgi:hypothetical protein
VLYKKYSVLIFTPDNRVKRDTGNGQGTLSDSPIKEWAGKFHVADSPKIDRLPDSHAFIGAGERN